MQHSIEATVQTVVLQGKHGPYAVATSVAVQGSITFSLDKEVWQERGAPEPGTMVVLSDLRKKQAGWRAMNGRFLRPLDEHQSKEKADE